MSEPTDVFELPFYHMVNAHDGFKVGYDSILTRLDNLPQDDLINFIGYCESWSRTIEHHHDTEEKIVFPVLNRRMNFSSEIEQHKLIHDFLDKYHEFLQEARKNPKQFDFTQLKALMEVSKETLYSHLDAELEHITAENLREAQFTVPELKDMLHAMENYGKSKGDPFLTVPFMRSHTPPEMKHWPALPWIVRSILVPYVLAKRHSGYWKYAPYAMS